MKKMIYLSGSKFAIAQACPGNLAFDFSSKLMQTDSIAQDGTDKHEEIANDIESMRRYLPEKSEWEYIEPRLNASYGSFNLSGGVDFYSISDDRKTLTVVDWKTGPAGIEDLGSLQIEFYAYLILKGLPYKDWAKIKTVDLVLVAPGLNHKKTFSKTLAEIVKDTENALDQIGKAIAKKEALKPGGHCRYCDKRFICPALRNELKRFAEPAWHGKPVEQITAGDLKTLQIAAAAITDIRKYVVDLIENGATIQGAGILTQNAARFFPDGVDEFMLAKKLKTSPDLLIEKKLRSPAQLEKLGYDLAPVSDLVATSTKKVLKVSEVKQPKNTEKQPKTQQKGKTK